MNTRDLPLTHTRGTVNLPRSTFVLLLALVAVTAFFVGAIGTGILLTPLPK